MITVLGAHLGFRVSLTLYNVVRNPFLIVLAVVSTIVVMYLLMKVDLGGGDERSEDVKRVRGLWVVRPPSTRCRVIEKFLIWLSVIIYKKFGELEMWLF